MTDTTKNVILTIEIFGVCLFFCAMAGFGIYRWNERLFYDRMAAVVSVLPDRQGDIMKALKDVDACDVRAGREILGRYSYYGHLPEKIFYVLPGLGSVAAAFAAAGGAFFLIYREKRKLKKRTVYLTEYLRQVEEGTYGISLEKSQDIFSNLEDEIYKTVLALRESRERLEKEKENLARNLADISHQLKTPLTSLNVLNELLQRRLVNKEDIALARKMEIQTERLSGLTAALLTLSRADAGVLSFEIREVPVSELISCALESVLPLLEEKKQRIRICGESDVFLPCDLGWTKEAVGNLLKNASEQSPEQTEITIRVWENPIYTGIAIEDEGRGFSDKELPRLFERFYRGESARKGGAGIGLSLAKSLVESQNGEIRAQNRAEGGARFLMKFYKIL
ncbi:MAG: HAMP domain-containing histidine kinase [Lachnospiraceae bacterium]|nr:HAMP domain-containing histidine kinase [Lachnospiraceae bacterium]